MMYEKSCNIFIFFDFLKGMSFASFGSNFSSFFNVRSKDVYSERKFELSIVDILPLIAFKPGWFLYFEIVASMGSKRFKLKPLGKFLLVRVSKFWKYC